MITKDQALSEKVEAFQNLLIDSATARETGEGEYEHMRGELLAVASIGPVLPRFVRTCRSGGQFWQFIKRQSPTYEGRREFIWAEFKPLLDKLEGFSAAPADAGIAEALRVVDAEHVHSAWEKALERRHDDPDGAITAARTLVETVCKHILDEQSVEYDDGADLPALYRATAQSLNLAPEQHQEPIVKQILGGCVSVVSGLGAMSNNLSDAHGKGKGAAKPASRHAELAVNLSGTVASFLLATWEARTHKAT